MFDLEIYPRLIYFERVDKNGYKPHEGCVADGKISPDIAKKNNPIPLHELSITKKATFDMLLKHFCEVFNEPNDATKKGRLHIETQIISGLKLNQTLEELGCHTGSVIYVEFLEANNTWPTDNLKNKSKIEFNEVTVVGL